MSAFAAEWERRVTFLANLLSAARTECGSTLMNIIYEEWLKRVSYEWTYQ